MYVQSLVSALRSNHGVVWIQKKRDCGSWLCHNIYGTHVDRRVTFSSFKSLRSIIH